MPRRDVPSACHHETRTTGLQGQLVIYMIKPDGVVVLEIVQVVSTVRGLRKPGLTFAAACRLPLLENRLRLCRFPMSETILGQSDFFRINEIGRILRVRPGVRQIRSREHFADVLASAGIVHDHIAG